MWNNVEMKKINTLNHHTKDGQEKSKKIYRSISERVKTLDDARGCASQINDLFMPSIQIHRSKLQEYCERLIFSEPLSFGLKAEELLWRKAYYEVIATAKRLKKQEYNIEEKSALINHINAGIGHYHHYISRLQTEFEVSYVGIIDFHIITSTRKEPAKDIQDWCLSSVHRSCIYLGDLCRYKLEINPKWDANLAIRYYSQALLLKPDYGMPHNQMGTLATFLNQHLDATYHYIQCMMSKSVFEGTENNLHRLFEKNSQYLEQLPVESTNNSESVIPLEPVEQVRRFIARFLLLTDVWFFNKKIAHIYDLCHQTNVDLQECLSFLRPISSESGGSQNGDTTESDTSAAFLTSDMIFKIIVICLQCITKLQNLNNSHQLSNVIAFTLAVYSQLVQNITSKIQESVLNFQISKNKKKKFFTRRRKKNHTNSDEETESESDSIASEDEEDNEEDIDSPVEMADSSSDEDVIVEDTNGTSKDTTKEVLAKVKLIDVKDMLDIISEETYFPSVKILSDWLQTDVDVLHSCGKTTRSLFTQLAYLFNLINIDLRKVKSVQKLSMESTPLNEDVLLKGMEVILDGQKGIDWNKFGAMGLKKQDEVLIRISRIIAFGRFLEQHPETGVSYDIKSRTFNVDLRTAEQDVSPTTINELEALEENSILANTKSKEKDTKRQLMKHMGQLWLAAEVRDLETRVKGKMSLSPYLVVDVAALIKHMDMVKHLVYSRKFLILVPTAVLCALDDLKKVKPEAREVIRWLESQFRQGNRFFRPQRHHERLTLPLIKYPKKKEKEAVVHIQIIECCHYLAEQEKRAGSNLVTLLMGGGNGTGEVKEFSYVGLAQSVGVNVEMLSEFYAKWKKSSKVLCKAMDDARKQMDMGMKLML